MSVGSTLTAIRGLPNDRLATLADQLGREPLVLSARCYRLILVIFEPCSLTPAINPFWRKTNA